MVVDISHLSNAVDIEKIDIFLVSWYFQSSTNHPNPISRQTDNRIKKQMSLLSSTGLYSARVYAFRSN